MEFSCVKTQIKDKTAWITIDRPPLNALNLSLLQELTEVFKKMDQDLSLHSILLTGSGKSFVAGADIAEMATLSADQARTFSLQGHALMNTIEGLSIPVVAAVNGFALGGGCELAMACDLRIASETASFGQPEINLGILPGFGGTFRLSRLVGPSQAKKLVLTGDRIDASKALEIGLVDEIVPEKDLLAYCEKICHSFNRKSRLTLKNGKEALRLAQLDCAHSAAIEADRFALCFASQDQKEGMQAFLEKRPAVFENL